MDEQTLKDLASIHRQEMQEASKQNLDMALYTIGQDVVINGVQKKVVLENRSNRDGNEKVAFAPVNDLNVGDMIIYNNQKWLAISYPVFTEVYSKTYLKRCNSTIQIPNVVSKVKTGEDWRGIPQYKEQVENTVVDCVVETRIYDVESDKPINLPMGKMIISLPYNNDSKKVKLNFEFEMYGDKYKVVRIDRNYIIGERGILILTCELVN